MKIISFSANNFRSLNGGLENNTIKFDGSDTIFIFGQNNVGKSTFLKAYEFFWNSGNDGKAELNDFFKQKEENQIEMKIVLQIEEKDFAEIEAKTDGKLQIIRDDYLDENNFLCVRKIWREKDKKATVKEMLSNSNEWKENYGSIGLDAIFQSILPRPIFIRAMPTEEEAKKIVNEILEIKAKRMLAQKDLEALAKARDVISELQDKIYDPQNIQCFETEVNKHFSSLFTDLEIGFKEESKVKYTADKLGKTFDVTCTHKVVEGLPDDFKSLGHGTIRTALFTLCLMQETLKDEVAPKDIIVLFEEPELFLHPSLTKRLRRLIYDVSAEGTPFQILCASHSPQMIDISKPKTSLVRMVKRQGGTKIYQLTGAEEVEIVAGSRVEKVLLKEKIQEILRFNPFLCEAFYADEVILVEGDSEELLFNAYLKEAYDGDKDIFIVNCGSVTNIPFFQEIFSTFSIHYSVICDTDSDKFPDNIVFDSKAPKFDKNIQGSISSLFYAHKELGISRYFFVHDHTLEHVYRTLQNERYWLEDQGIASYGKPFVANAYWVKLKPMLAEIDIDLSPVPFISYLRTILRVM